MINLHEKYGTRLGLNSRQLDLQADAYYRLPYGAQYILFIDEVYMWKTNTYEQKLTSKYKVTTFKLTTFLNTEPITIPNFYIFFII